MKIDIHCQTCDKVHNVARTPEIPANVASLSCNWCPACEDRAEGYYKEWYNYEEVKPDPVDPNQISLFN